MKKILFVTLAALVGLFGSVLPAAAKAPNPPTLDWRTPTNVNACPAGKVVINITHGVTHDADSKVGGGVWAFDRYSRSIKVVDVGPGSGSFCAVVRYDGEFTSFAGSSPQGTGTVEAGVEGSFRGGYRTVVFTGNLIPNPVHPRHGDIGTFDYGCLATDSGGGETCTNLFSWRSTYFTGLSANAYDLAWWGWIYRTDDNGTWVNAITGNLGDITGGQNTDGQDSGGQNTDGQNQNSEH